MDDSFFETLRFHRYRDFSGQVHRTTGGRRNGKPAIFFSPTSFEPEPAPDTPDYSEEPRFFLNLNAVERATWKRLLSAQSIASIAEQDGVSRPAIYARIEGNGKGQGGMIAKNFWVLLWWRLRQRQNGMGR
jgi:hypothetical protein